MQERDLQNLIEDVRAGDLPRRAFIQQMLSLGLTVPMASVLLMNAGVVQAQSAQAYKPTKRGGGGALKLLFWQGPTLLNPHFATGQKDVEGSRIFYEGLTAWDVDGNLTPVLAAEIPSRENGGLAADGKSVVWKLKKGVTWHDGAPFTADDVVFNWQYASDPAGGTFTVGLYLDLKYEKIDTHTVRVMFNQATPFWPGSYSGALLIPKHLFADYRGARTRDAPNNLKPVGTGPYKFVDFKPGDMVRAEINTNYHMPNRPHFDTLELKGGGDAVSAARAVLQTGEYDFGWNLLVEDEILKRMETNGKGRVVIAQGGSVEYIQLNYTDPNVEIEGERAHPKSRHPVFSDPVVRQAMSLLIDRQGVQNFIYGRAGVATANWLNNPPRYHSPNMKFEFSIDKANALLDGAGWARGSDGVREKGGRKLKFLFQTSVNSPRQKVQAIVKQACQKAGIELELKSIIAAVFFSSDVANPDTFGKFWADIQMLSWTRSLDPERFMQNHVSWEIASKANKWERVNSGRWRNDDYDKAYRAAQLELDPVKRAALFIRMNDIVCSDNYILPLVYRPGVSGVGNKLVVPISGWGNTLGLLHDWYRET